MRQARTTISKSPEGILILNWLNFAGLSYQAFLLVIFHAHHIPIPVMRIGGKGRLLR
jgi:hypothetical protein